MNLVQYLAESFIRKYCDTLTTMLYMGAISLATIRSLVTFSLLNLPIPAALLRDYRTMTVGRKFTESAYILLLI